MHYLYELTIKDSGIYEVSVASYGDYACDVLSRVYIKKKDKPENKKRIEEIDTEVTHQVGKIEEYDNQILETQHARDAAAELKEIYQLNKQNKEAQVKKVKDEIARAERERDELTSKNQKEAQRKESAKTYLAGKKELLATMSNLIGHGIIKESNLSKSFQEHYAAYQKIKDLGFVDAVSMGFEDVPSYLLCPITDELLQDTVMTSCGHTFSSAALLNWLINQQKNCPTCKKQITTTDFQRNLSIQDAITDFQAKRLQEQDKKLRESKLH